MLKAFKEFAMRGNVVDLAVAFILGAAFSNIVQSLVNDIIMPPIGLVLGKVDFASLFINISGQSVSNVADAKKAGIPVIAYGQFINTLINFIIVAFVLFLIVRQINRLKSQPQPPTPTTRDCPYCLSTIPLKATRCPDCTSELPPAAPVAPAPAKG